MPTTCLKIDDVAKRLCVSPSKVRSMVRARTIPHAKLGHRTLIFREQDIESWLAKKIKG